MSTMKTKALGVRLPVEAIDQLRAIAQRDGLRGPAAAARRLIEAALAQPSTNRTESDV